MNYFERYRRLRSTAEKTRFRRTEDCETRAEHCYKTPKPEDMGRAVLWRYMHTNGEECENCPRCMVLPGLTILNQLSSSLTLLQFDRADKSKEQNDREKREAFARIAFPQAVFEKLPGGTDRSDGSFQSLEQFFMVSGKLKRLHTLLKAIDKEGGRVLLFSGSTQTLDLIQNYLKFVAYTFLRIDGSTPAAKRQG